MARDIDNDTPIENEQQLAAYLAEGCKDISQFRVGTEHEKFVYDTRTGNPVPYEGEHGIRSLLEGMQHLLGWQPIMEGKTLIGLADVTGGGAISLEPGGQFELSGAPLKTLHETSCEVRAHMAQVHQIAGPLGLDFFAQGTCPHWSREDIPVMPKGRYKIMSSYMPKVGTRGLDMMFRTCTVQANLDFASEADMARKMRVSIALQPLATALFANSPDLDGRPTGYLSTRSWIWLDTDNARSGMLPRVFEAGFGFESYVDWALDVPMYFVKRGAAYHDVAGLSFRDFLKGRLQGFENQRPTMADWINHLSTLFPEVRLKRYLEMRGADSGPIEMITALPAFWVGILYDPDNLQTLDHLLQPLTEQDRQQLREDVPAKGLETPMLGRSLREWGRDVVAMASLGLARRGFLDHAGCDESKYLEPLLRILDGQPLPGRFASLLHQEAAS